MRVRSCDCLFVVSAAVSAVKLLENIIAAKWIHRDFHEGSLKAGLEMTCEATTQRTDRIFCEP